MRSKRLSRRRILLATLILMSAVLGSIVWWNPGKPRDADQNHEESIPELTAPTPAFDWSGKAGDELATQIAVAQQKAAALETSLHRVQSDHDQLSDLVREVREQAQALEREIASGQATHSASPKQ